MFLDISFGILLSIFASQYFGLELTIFLVLLNIAFVLLPDIDFILAVLYRGKLGTMHSHREIFHHPLILIPLGFIILFIFNKTYALLFLLAISWHFLNDTITLGFGVHWLWPLSNKYFKFFGGWYYRAPGKPRLPFKILYIWLPQEIEGLEKNYGDPDWIKNIYLKFHPWAIFEYLIFMFSIILLIIYYVKIN